MAIFQLSNFPLLVFAAILGWGLTFAQPVELPFAEAQRNAISQPLPQYPQIAKQAGVSGSVHFKFNINEAGHVMDLELVSGHPLLIPNSSDTIQNWRYRPFKFLREQPREISTRIALRFDSEKGQVSLVAPPSLGENLNVGKEAPMTGTSEPYNVTSEVLGHHNRKVKWPPYPDGPLKEFQGTVRLNVIIAKSGRITKASALSGLPKLAIAATEAIKEWEYRPFLRKGAPVSVTGDVYFTFTQNPDSQMKVFQGDEIDALLDAATSTMLDLKLEAAETYCYEALRRAQPLSPDHSHTINEGLDILHQVYRKSAGANPANGGSLINRFVAAATEYEKPSGRWTSMALSDLGIYYLSVHEYAAAELEFKRAIAALKNCIDPEGVRICAMQQGDDLAFLGLTLYHQVKLAGSLPYFEQAIARPDGGIHAELKLLSLSTYSKALAELGSKNESEIAARRTLEYKDSHKDAARSVGLANAK